MNAGAPLLRHAERLLVGTGLDVVEAARVGAGGRAVPDSAAARALRDGWRADDNTMVDGGGVR